MSARKKSISLSSVDLDKLRDLYIARKLSIAETAKALDISMTSVWVLLKRLGVPRHQHGSAKYDLEEARRLYFDEDWTLQQIADRFKVSRQAVHQKLTLAGYDLKVRMKERFPTLDPGTLRELYINQNMTANAVAAKLNTTGHYVSKSLREHGIVRPPGHRKRFDRELIEDLYLRQGLVISEVAEKLGATRRIIQLELERHNITFRHKPGKRVARPDRKTIDRYYTVEGLTLVEIGRIVGVCSDVVRALLNEYGIEFRPRYHELSDAIVGRDRLYQLYVTEQMSGPQIARKLGISIRSVYKYLKRHGIQLREQ